MKQKIYFISFRDIRKINPSAIVMMKTCLELAEIGYEVVFLVPFFCRYRELGRRQVWDAYDIPPRRFRIVFLPVFFREGVFCRVFKVLSHLVYAFGVLASILARPRASVHIISRDILSTYAYLLLLHPLRRLKRVSFLYELHVPSRKLSHRFLYRQLDRLYCITDEVRRFLVEELGINPAKTATIRTGFDPSAYAFDGDKVSLRRELGLPGDRLVVMYTGKIDRRMKEIRMILAAAEALPDLLFVLVGGRPVNIEPLQLFCREHNIPNVVFTGLVPPRSVARYQLSADILLMYYPGDWPIRRSISPNKMMEYMASGNAIVSVDFENIREVLKHEKNALLVEPDNVRALVEAIIFLRRNPATVRALGEQARQDVAGFSWENRVRRIEKLIGSIVAGAVEAENHG